VNCCGHCWSGQSYDMTNSYKGDLETLILPSAAISGVKYPPLSIIACIVRWHCVDSPGENADPGQQPRDWIYTFPDPNTCSLPAFITYCSTHFFSFFRFERTVIMLKKRSFQLCFPRALRNIFLLMACQKRNEPARWSAKIFTGHCAVKSE
jgi:hypothetical protein